MKKRVSTVPAATGKNTPPSRSGEDKAALPKEMCRIIFENKKEDDSNNPFAAAFDKLNL